MKAFGEVREGGDVETGFDGLQEEGGRIVEEGILLVSMRGRERKRKKG